MIPGTKNRCNPKYISPKPTLLSKWRHSSRAFAWVILCSAFRLEMYPLESQDKGGVWAKELLPIQDEFSFSRTKLPRLYLCQWSQGRESRVAVSKNPLDSYWRLAMVRNGQASFWGTDLA